jgi:hypothetical protein
VLLVVCLLALMTAAAHAETPSSSDTTSVTDTSSTGDTTSTTETTTSAESTTTIETTTSTETTSTTVPPPTETTSTTLPYVPPPVVPLPTFPDVGSSMSSFQAVGFLNAAGVISGYQNGNFGPSDTLKRGQATKMLVLWQQVPLATNPPSFPDLDDVYRDYVGTACAEGWITGYADGRFKPYSTLSRQQMAIIMVRAMGWEDAAQGLTTKDMDGVLDQFHDQAQISDVARPYVAVAVSEGLFGGDGAGT